MAHPELTPRKQGVQKRSRLTLDAIFQATTQLLREDGFARLTTNRIVHRAGVSIGSLYQYFPTKGSVISALVEREFNQIAERMLAKVGELSTQADLPFDLAIRRIVDELFLEHRSYRKLFTEAFVSAFTIDSFRFMTKNDERIVAALRQWLVRYEDEVDLERIEESLALAVYLVKGAQLSLLLGAQKAPMDFVAERVSRALLGMLRKS